MAPNLGLRQALALAIVKQRREHAEIVGLKKIISGLESEMEALRAAPVPAGARAASCALDELVERQRAAGGGHSEPQPEEHEYAAALAQNALLWGRAAQTLQYDAAQGRLLAGVQLYLLRKDAEEATGGGRQEAEAGAALAGPLDRTPIQALLEVTSDLLDRLGAESGQQPEAGCPSQAAVAPGDLGACLRCALLGLSALAAQPGVTATAVDGICVQRFAGHLLQLATPPECDEQSAVARAPGERGLDLGQPLPGVAQQMLSLLLASGGTGLAVLVAAAALTQHSVQALVAHVTGGVSPSKGGEADGAAGGGEQAAALRFRAGARTLCDGLERLPGWVQQGAQLNESTLRSVADAVVSATDECRLVSLTHAEVVRSMQQASSRLMGALHRLSLMERPPGT